MKKGDQLKALSGEYQALSEMIHRAWPREQYWLQNKDFNFIYPFPGWKV